MIVDQNKCVGCGMCIDECSHGAMLPTRAYGVIIDQDKCINCGDCIAVCAGDAIGEE